PTLIPVSITNNNSSGGYFHAGISVTGSAAGSFGYFSDFSSINISYDNKPVCFGDSLVLDAGPGRDNYRWYTKSASTETTLSTSQKYKIDQPGEQLIYVRIEKGNCPLVDSVKVYIQPKVNLNVLKKKVACFNQPVSMDATPQVTNPPLQINSYSWIHIFGPGSANQSLGSTTAIAPQLAVGFHKIAVLVDDVNGCKFKDTVEVTINSTPPVSTGAFSDAQICSGAKVKLGQASQSIKYIYKWSEDDTPPPAQKIATGLSSTIISDPEATRTNTTTAPLAYNYYIATTDTSTSCIKLDTLVLTVNPIPKPVFTNLKTTFCKSDPAVPLEGTAPNFTAGGYAFSIGGVALTSFDPNAQGIGDKTILLKYTSQANCLGETDTIVKVSDVPLVAMTNKEYCSGQSATVGLTPDPTFNYIWDTSPDIPTANISEVTIKATNTTSAPITNTYKLTVTSKTNATCTNNGTVDVKIKPVPEASFTGLSATGHCLNSPNISLVGSPAAGVFSSTSDALTGTNTFTPKTEGSKTLTYSVNIDGCVDDTVVTTMVHPLPKPTINGIDKLTYCADEPALTITGANPTGGTFQKDGTPWTEGNFPLAATGNYKFKYAVTDLNGCQNSVEKSLEVKPIPILTTSPATPICEGQSATLSANGGDTYKWTTLTNTTGTVTVNPLVTTDYEVRAVSPANCISAPSIINLVVNATPKANFKNKNITHCFEDGNVKLFAGIAPTYTWNTGATTDTLEVSDGGFFRVTLSSGICKTSDSVKVIAGCPPRLFLPQAFTPNNDGNNDQLEIFGAHFQNFEMKIFNKWGEIVYTTNDKDKPWDGKYLGEDMPIGVYPWIVTYESELPNSSSKSLAMNGSVTLIR
ncbi:MAG TPA: gliding motility-associated C-terminal domain-containing protein, partial [Cytophagaceae bacterium]